MKVGACDNCTFSLEVEEGNIECHRFPPTENGWPVIIPLRPAWCGEWKNMDEG
jgi:hypothetical protein